MGHLTTSLQIASWLIKPVAVGLMWCTGATIELTEASRQRFIRKSFFLYVIINVCDYSQVIIKVERS